MNDITPEELIILGFAPEKSNDSDNRPVYGIQVGNITSLYYSPTMPQGEQWFVAQEWNNNYGHVFWGQPTNMYAVRNLYRILAGEDLCTGGKYNVKIDFVKGEKYMLNEILCEYSHSTDGYHWFGMLAGDKRAACAIRHDYTCEIKHVK